MPDDDLDARSEAELEAEVRRLEALVRARRARVRGEGAAARRTLDAILAAVDGEVGRERVDQLFRRAGLEPRDARTGTGAWVPWEEYERILDALEPLATDAVALRVGARSMDSPFLRFLPLGARALPSLEAMLRWALRVGAGPGGLVYRGCEVAVNRLADDAIDVRFRAPAGGHLPKLWIGGTAGAFERLAEVASGSAATVTVMREGTATARFVIRHAPSRRRGLVPFLFRVKPPPPEGAVEQARDELQHRNEELRARIAELEASERERAELRERLEEQLQMEAVGRLAGGIAHDFNNLLGAALGQIELLERCLDGEEALTDLRVMRAAAERAAALSRRLLVVGRQQALELEELVLDDVVRSCRGLVAATAGEPVTVRLELDAAEARVAADASQLESALAELALNAGEAMPDGGELTISTSVVEAEDSFARDHPEAPTGRLARLSVRDSGPGMSPETRARALEPFFSTRVGRRAAGLGLSTVHGFVRQLGGVLAVRSSPGEGTEIEIFLPLVDGSA